MNLNGLGVALITPFTQQDEIDELALSQLTDRVINEGVDYIVALGTTAETPTLTAEEKQRVLSIVAEANGKRVPLVLGMGSNATKSLCTELQQLEASRFDAILSVTPFYNKPSQQGLIAHYAEVASASPLPVILYNVPSRTGVNMTPETVLELAHSSSQIIGIKEACGDYAQIDAITQHAPNGFSVLSGDDATAIPSILNGASGVISVIGQGMIDHTLAAVKLALQKDETALSLHHSLLPMIDLIFEQGNPAGIKALLSMQNDLLPNVRLPLIPATSDLALRIGAELQKLRSITV
ncbi:MAG: 4-hydroxy-tetrahydrodipicolinate synthase [Flavobacteriaceae bacterium]